MIQKQLFIFFLLLIIIQQSEQFKPAQLPAAPYGVWLHHSQGNQQAYYDLIGNYSYHGIKVGGINIDSGWSTGYNNFIWDTNLYPDAKQLVSDMHDQNIKVMCWMTSFINEDSSNFQEGLKNNYFMNNGTILKWWHGKGALLDYSNPDALNWWNNQLNNVLDIGIDGFKTDGSDPYLYMLLPQPTGYIGEIDHRQYANYYYNETFNQVRKVRGLDGLIMARPMALLVPGEYSYWLYLRYSPNDIVFSGWMGDQKGTFDGIKVALRMMFHSSVYNATNFGSDIGGYLNDHDYPQGRSKEVFIRWAQLGALNPLMENGGGGNHEPWAWDGETVEIYKKFVNIHYELFPFFYASGSQAFEKQKSVMQPVAQIQDKLADFSFPSSYDFTLWNSIHVSPIIKNKTVTTVQFPQGQTEWVDYWTHELYDTQKISKYQVPLNKFPIFLKRESIIPMNITTEDSLYGPGSKTGILTFVIPYPQIGSEEQGQIRDDKVGGAEFSYSFQKIKSESQLTFISTPIDQQITLLIEGVIQLNSISEYQNGKTLQKLESFQELTSYQSGYFLGENNRLWINPGQSNSGWQITIKSLKVITQAQQQ